MFEREFLITADMEGRNIYQLSLGEGRIVRLLAHNSDRRPVAVAFQEPGRVIYWTDVAAARIVSLPLSQNFSITRPTTVYATGFSFNFIFQCAFNFRPLLLPFFCTRVITVFLLCVTTYRCTRFPRVSFCRFL